MSPALGRAVERQEAPDPADVAIKGRLCQTPSRTGPAVSFLPIERGSVPARRYPAS